MANGSQVAYITAICGCTHVLLGISHYIYFVSCCLPLPLIPNKIDSRNTYIFRPIPSSICFDDGKGSFYSRFSNVLQPQFINLYDNLPSRYTQIQISREQNETRLLLAIEEIRNASSNSTIRNNSPCIKLSIKTSYTNSTEKPTHRQSIR